MEEVKHRRRENERMRDIMKEIEITTERERQTDRDREVV